MVEQELPKLKTRVRFSSPAPTCGISISMLKIKKIVPSSLALLLSTTIFFPVLSAGNAPDAIVVTGTHAEGTKARESDSPIDVIRSEDLSDTGQTNLLDALKILSPSLNSPAVGYDVGALARTMQLRGLSPSQTLVLVNGKRRHLSASLYADEDPAQGSNGADLDMIPLSAIDHVEILKDGAAAQYGSDAIAGVVNVILKKASDGGSLSLSGGGYGDGGGATGQADLDYGMKLGSNGVIDFSLGYRAHDFSNRSGDTGGLQPAKIQGDPQSTLVTFAYNLEKPINDSVSLYSFATLASRRARAYEDPREPGAISSDVDSIYPNGFTPMETISEIDFGFTAGLKGKSFSELKWDISSTYGRDDSTLHNIKTINPNLLTDTGNAQKNFNVGSFTLSELTHDIDFQYPLFVQGLAKPLLVSFGFQDIYETYAIGAGEPNSYYNGGSQAFPGFMPYNTTNASRNSFAAYLDLTAHITDKWEVSLAGRGDYYDKLGFSQTGKISMRYDFTPNFAMRGSASTGYHAPTLAQEYYSATNVAPQAATIQLPVDSAGAKILGAPALKAETSKNFSFGFVTQPSTVSHITLDFYQIDIDKRIIDTGLLNGDLALSAIEANGATAPAGLTSNQIFAQFFTNGVNTRTRGLDLSVDYRTDLGLYGMIKWIVSSGLNNTEILKTLPESAIMQSAGLTLVDSIQKTNLTSATPRLKTSLSALYLFKGLELTLRETIYGHTSQVQGYGPFFLYQTIVTPITDINIGYALSDSVRVDLGGNNIFNQYPMKIPSWIYQQVNYDQYSHLSPFGINGGYYYGKISYKF